jgi:hypothetical protein
MLAATAEGRFDFPNTNMDGLVDFKPMPFADWLIMTWDGKV